MTGDVPTRGGFLVGRWWQLGAGIVAMMAIANLQYAWTLFTVHLTQSLHATLSAVQVAFTLFILTETWLVPFEGYLVDRLGARLIVTAGGVLVGLGWIGSGIAGSLGGLYGWYSLGGVGAGAVYGACVGTALKWFPDRRGLAARAPAGAHGLGTAPPAPPIPPVIHARGHPAPVILGGAGPAAGVLVPRPVL